MNTNSSVWLPEPITSDDTFANRGESTLKWLARSTIPQAKEYRRFLNENVSKLPVENQNQIKHDLRKRFDSAFFELVVARLLQEWGANVVIEESNIDGKKPDFKAEFSEGQIIVEAKSPIINAQAEDELRSRIPLLNYIESKTPLGWQIGVWELPKIGGSDSQKEFKKAVDRMLDTPLPFPILGSDAIELIETISSGNIYFYLYPAMFDPPKLIWEGSISASNDSKNRIRYAMKSKKRQIRNSEAPVILAIQTGLISELEDFDIALFGGSFESYDVNHRLIETGFLPCGDFAKNIDRSDPPNYAGVLAFLGVNFAYCIPPVFYRNPRFAGVLPNAILQLEQRSYDRELNKIQVQAASSPDLTNRLNFITI